MTDKMTRREKELLIKHAPHFHVVSRGSDSEMRGLVNGASPDFVRATSAVAKLISHEDPDKDKMLKDLGNSRKTIAARHAIMKGEGFGDVMKSIGHWALKALPTVAPMLLSLL